MIDLLLGFGLSNLFISMLLAAVAWTVQKKTQKPLLAHLLWLLVLVKLVTPSIFTLPLVEVPTVQAQILAQIEAAHLANATGHGDRATSLNPAAAIVNPDFSAFQADALGALNAKAKIATHAWIDPLKNTLAIIWITGSLAILGWSCWRVFRFNQLLKAASQPASAKISATATDLARRLGLRHTPQVVLANAQIPPMVWWIGGRERIVLPQQLVQEMPADELRWLLAHEVGHVRRRDHWVRWLEWISCIAFWWNPVTWMARQHLRVNEEICCDALVMASLRPNPKTYANSLLNAVEFLLAPLQRPPAMASEINNGGVLERRLKMIISKTSLQATPRWMTAAILFCAVVLLPIGVAHAQEPDVNAVTARLIAAVKAGELTESQAARMMGALAEARFSETMATAKTYKVNAVRERWDVVNLGKPEMVDQFYRAGVSNETYKKVLMALHESGIKRELLDPVMGAMMRLMWGVQREEYVRPIYAHLRELGLTDDQAKLVHKYSRKLAQALAERKAVYNDRDTALTDRFDLAAQEIQNAIASGKVSKQEGQAKLRAMKEEMKRYQEDSNRVNAELRHNLDQLRKDEAAEKEVLTQHFHAAAQRIKDGVASGQISKEEGLKNMETLKKEMARAKQGVSEPDRLEIIATRGEYGNVVDQLAAEMDAGRISNEDARARLDALRQRMYDQQNEQKDLINAINQRFDVAAQKIQEAVKSGNISAEEGRGELMELRQKLADIEAEMAAQDDYRQLEPRVERLRLLEDREAALRAKDMKMEYELVMQQVRKAVAAGEMTREQASAKLLKVKEAMKKASTGDREK